ncbi:MAG: hypothetical protein WC683_08160 [bacterium]
MTDDGKERGAELEAALRAAYEAGFKRGAVWERTREWVWNGQPPTTTYEIYCAAAFAMAEEWLREHARLMPEVRG